MAIVQKASSANGLVKPPIEAYETTEQLMDSAVTPEQKKAAFMSLYLGSDETISKAVDCFYKDPVLFSETVQNLAASVSDKLRLQTFLHKMSESEARICSFIAEKYEASLDAKTTDEFKDALKPYHALKAAFEGVERNRKAMHSCPSACDLLQTFNTANDQINRAYAAELFKKVARQYVMDGPQ